MKHNIITTADGSRTIQIEEWNEHYHSVHGAIQEAKHVFVKHGLLFLIEKAPKLSSISVLEIGFGTGLNAFITLLNAEELNLKIDYVGVEAYPVLEEEIKLLNYVDELGAEAYREAYKKMHQCPWETSNHITSHFQLNKQQKDFKDIKDENIYDLIYFDAFGARVQPELWMEAIFEIMYTSLKPEGILVTYSAKGSVRRAMQSVGFKVEKLPGPPGKREMLRATKHSAIRSEPNVN